MAKKPLRRRLAAVLVGLVAAALVAELALRIHNPIPLRLRGSDIVLPVLATFERDSGGVPGLDEHIVVHHNSLGLRGEEPPPDPEHWIKLFTVGGSTTECVALNDGKTWSDLLLMELRQHFDAIWLDNAGLDGHSTFGHVHLLDQVLLRQRPDYLVFLVGVNDVDRDDPNTFDLSVRPENVSLTQRLVHDSELLSTIQVLLRVARARDLGLHHVWHLDLEHGEHGADDPAAVAALLRRQHDVCLPRYRERLRKLVAMSRSAGAEPVLVTQPALFGDVVDRYTGQALGHLLHAGRTSAVWSQLLALVNDVTREVGRQSDVLVIELADAMPKDSRLYYDWTHYTNAGAARVAAIVAGQLVPFLEKRHPKLRRQH